MVDDEDENAVNNSTNSHNCFPQNIIQLAKSVKSKHGWVWIGGIQGSSQDAFQAMEEAMSILKCRYAVMKEFLFFFCFHAFEKHKTFGVFLTITVSTSAHTKSHLY